MTVKQLYITTIGCQMNVYDAGQMAGVLAPLGYTKTDAIETADLIVVNTCTIREKAEQKAFSFLGRLAKYKAVNPDLIVAVGGCVAQQKGKAILKRVPHVDLVFGTHAIFRLPELIRKIQDTRRRLVDVRLSDTLEKDPAIITPVSEGEISSFVTIMRGCDNYCTYCVVPHVRGREASRHPGRICEEIRMRVDQGIREVTLLGQNVNSYGNKEGLCTFVQLLEQINEIPGLERIRFTTSHPKDLSPELIHAFGRLEKLCHHIHLPVQSGDDAILKRMNRRYTRDLYLEKIDRLRESCPDMGITSDFIVGFPGETDTQFEATCDLIEKVRYDSLFAFMYSDRPGAPAAAFSEKVSESVKKSRLQTLLDLQAKITAQKYQALVGACYPILVEGTSRFLETDDTMELAGDRHSADRVQWTGRTAANHIVHFSEKADAADPKPLTGTLVTIRIEGVHAHSLWGRRVSESSGIPPETEKGEKTIAA